MVTSLEHTKNIYVALTTFLFFSLSVSFSYGYKISSILILLSYIFFTYKNIRSSITFHSCDKFIFTAIIAYSLTLIMEFIIFDLSAREVEPAAKAILLLPFLLLANNSPFIRNAITYGLITAPIFLFSSAAYDIYILEKSRANGGINAIQYGSAAMLISLLCLLVPLISSHKSRLIPLISLLGFSGALYSVFLSGTRGAFLALPIALFLILKQSLSLKLKIFSALVIIVLAAIGLITSKSDSRIHKAITEFSVYYSEGKGDGSIGQRLDMWKVAYINFEKSPIIGTGKDKYLAFQKDWIEKKLVSHRLSLKSHAHNAYLDSLSRRGVIGLLGLLAFLLTPIFIGIKYIKVQNNTIQGYSIALITLGTSYSLFNLTQTIFSHSNGIIIYTVTLLLLSSALSFELRKLETQNY